ncbi:MAG TPA: ATP-binding protein [Steroidobacteraceae bacterium]|jgi:light-regulated signal transduction histidine kinase (bacteriophytochrome)
MPRTIALIYLAFGVVWIFFTDRLLAWLHLDPQLILKVQTAKGWLFVLGSAILLYVALRRYERRGRDALAALIESRNEVRRANADLEHRVAERTRQLEAANRELEAFAYAVSHDLRAPLRSMSGFSQILQETAPPGLDEKSRHYLQRIHDASLRMSGLIDDLLNLSRIGRSELTARPISLSQVAAEAAAAVRERHPTRTVQLEIAPGMEVSADPRLLRIALENLLSNAWKYTSRSPQAQVTIGSEAGEQGAVYFVRDNGVGFDMKYADKLFVPFQRLHPEAEFPGNGIGLVTVQRILARHGGRIWADAREGGGATFYFTL